MNSMELCRVFNVFPTFSDAATWPYGCVWKWILPNSINSRSSYGKRCFLWFSQHVQRMVVYGSIPIFGASEWIPGSTAFLSVHLFQGEILRAELATVAEPPRFIPQNFALAWPQMERVKGSALPPELIRNDVTGAPVAMVGTFFPLYTAIAHVGKE